MLIVDPAHPDTPESLQEIWNALGNLLDSGQIVEGLFYKGLILLAGRYALLGDMATALTLATSPPAEYFRELQVAQMDEDPDYQLWALDLAAKFVAAGMVAEEVLGPTQKPGVA